MFNKQNIYNEIVSSYRIIISINSSPFRMTKSGSQSLCLSYRDAFCIQPSCGFPAASICSSPLSSLHSSSTGDVSQIHSHGLTDSLSKWQALQKNEMTNCRFSCTSTNCSAVDQTHLEWLTRSGIPLAMKSRINSYREHTKYTCTKSLVSLDKVGSRQANDHPVIS